MKAIFVRKPVDLKDVKMYSKGYSENQKSQYVIKEVKEMDNEEWEKLTDNLIKDHSFLGKLDGFQGGYLKDGTRLCIEIKNIDTGKSILVDPSGYSYCRYVALKE